MAQQIIDLTGSAVDSVRAAFKKINENFTEVFTACGPAGTGTYANTVSQTSSQIDLGDSITAVGGDSVRAAFVKIIANFDALYAVLPGTQQTINLGSGPNTQTGDTVVSAFDKINTNFTNLYTTLGLTPTTPESEDPAYTSFTPKVYDLSRDTVDTSSTVDDANTFADPYTTGLQLIDLGAGPDTQTGDSVYVAFTKVNHNFVELYDVFGPNGNTNIQGNTITANNFVTPATGTVRTGDITAYGNVETTGNVIASGFFYPNGVAISGSGTGSYGNANVADYLASNSNVTITTTANITGRYFFGNGSQLTGLVASSGNVGYANIAGTATTVTGNAQPNITSVGTLTSLTITGNVSANYFIGNGSQLTGIVTYTNANVASYLPIYSGNLNSINNITMTGNLSVGGNITYQNVETGNLEVANAIIVSGNVTASYFIGNGATLTSLTGANVVGNVTSAISATYITGLTGTNVNVALGYVPLNSNATALTAQYVTGNSQPNITSVGNLSSLTVTGNVSANYFIGNGRNLTGIDATSIQNGNSNVKVYYNSNVGITANDTTWTFGTDGRTIFPNGATFTGYDFYAAANSYIELAGSNDNTYVGLDNNSVFIQTDWNNTQKQWTFSSDGNLTSPGNIIVNGNVTANNFFGNITQLYNNGYTATLNDSGQLSSYFIQASSGYFTSPYGIAFTYAGDTNQQFSWTIVNADALALKSTISSTLDTTLLTFDRTTGNLSLVGNVYTTRNITADTGYFTNINSTGSATFQSLTANADSTFNSNLLVIGNLIVSGNVITTGSNNTYFTDSILELHTLPNLANLTYDDGKDIGLRFHYYKTNNQNAFLGWDNTTGYLEWFGSNVNETASSNISGNYGTIKAGSLLLVNTTPTTGNATGALQVSGGISTGGNFYAVGNITGTNGSFTTMTITGNISANNYLGNAIPLSTPTDGNVTDGAITSWSTVTSLADAIDDLNEALDNVRANTFVKSTTFTGSPLSGGAGTNVVLTITSVGNPNSYSVNWGDGNVTSGASASPSHVYSNNTLSPFTVTVTSSNSNGSGTGSSANFTRTNYIIIYTADPVMGFSLFRTNTGGSALSGTGYQTGLYVNEGETFYLQNTTTNTTMANVTYSINFGDGAGNANVASDSAPGGVLGNRYPYTYGYTASSGTGTNTVNLTILTHTTANPASIPRSTTVGLKVYDVNIAAPSGLSSKTITFTGNVGTTPYLAASFANNTGGSSTITAGSAVARTIATSGTIDTANLTSFSYNANAGVLSAYVNGVDRGNVTLASGDQSGTYGNLVVTSESDYWLLTSAGVGTTFALSTYSPNLYAGFTAQVKSTASTTLSGLNNFKLVHSTTGNTNIVEFVKDNVTTVPTVDVGNASVYQGSAGTFRYVSGIPYYNTGSPTVIVSNVRISSWIGQTYSGPASTVNPITVEAGTNQESTTGNVIVTQAKGYSTIDGNVTYLSSTIPIANTGASTGYAIGNMTVNVAGVASVQAVQTIRFIANNVNGSSSYSATTANIQVFTATPSGFAEESITCTVTDNAGANSQVAKRVVITSASGATPTYVTTRNYYSSNAWTGSQTIAGTDEAVTRFGNLKPFTTDLSTGYLPVGPNLAVTSGRTSTQYFRGAWARTGRNSWNVTITGKISGLYFAVPGTSIDTLPFTANGWLDANVAYFGSGVAGALSSGCAASTPVPYSQTISGTTYGITLGTGSTSASGSTGNQVLFSIALGPTDYVTSWSFS